MRILLLNQCYLPDVAATGQLLADLAASLVRHRHEVHVVCSRRLYGGGSKKLNRREVINGVHVHRIVASGFGNGRVYGSMLDYFSFYFFALWKVLFLPRADICLALTSPPFIGLLALILKRLKKTQFVIWTMDVYPEIASVLGTVKCGSMIYRLMSGINRKLYSEASSIISLGEIMTQRLIEAGAESSKIKVVDNWVPGESVKPVSSEKSHFRKLWNLNNYITVMYCGSVGMGFNVSTFISAMQMLGNTTKFRVIFVGGGRRKTQLQELINKHHFRFVHFYSSVSITELSEVLAVGDIHIVSQAQGTQGLTVPSKLYGIMAAGKPVLFMGPEDSDCARIIRRAKCGLIISSNHAKSLAEAINVLIEQPEERIRMGARGRKYYERYLGRVRSEKIIIKTIETAVTGKAARAMPRALHIVGKQ